MRHWIHAFAAAALMSLPIAARADEKPARLAAITLENDFFAGYDHHYTNGVQAAFVASPGSWMVAADWSNRNEWLWTPAPPG